jgi:hypothetical protein
VALDYQNTLAQGMERSALRSSEACSFKSSSARPAMVDPELLG